MKHLQFMMIILIIAGAGLKVAAEQPPLPTLTVPSLSDFLTTAQSILNDSSTPSETMPSLVELMDAEFRYRYLSTATYKERRQAFDILKIDFNGQPPVMYPRISLNQWIAWIVDAWLAENPIDLDTVQKLQFDDFKATIEQRDFNGDGAHEWLLDLTKGTEDNTFEYRNWMVIARQGNDYHAIPVPIWPGYHGDWDFPSAYSMQPEEGDFVDITDDGIPEWFIGQQVSPWGNILGQSYQDSILSWQDGRIVNVTPNTDTFDKANLDNDPALELFNIHDTYDSWYCIIISKSVYDWNGKEFAPLGKPVVEKKNCIAREAEEAMWNGDFQTAVKDYNIFLKLKSNSDNYSEYNDCVARNMDCINALSMNYVAMYNYFLTRRAIAYALLGEKQNVDSSLAELRSVPYPDVFGQAILSLNSTNPEKICKAAYDFFAPQKMRYGEADVLYGVFTPGYIYEDLGTYGSSPTFFIKGPPDPLKAGCDITLFSPEPTPTPTATPSPAPTYTLYPTPTTERKMLNESIAPYFRSGDYASALWISEHANERINQQPDDSLEMKYWQGLTLEALGRNQEALSAYMELVSTAPDSAWGRLAKLHYK